MALAPNLYNVCSAISDCGAYGAQVTCLINLSQGATGCVEIQIYDKNLQRADLSQFNIIQVLVTDTGNNVVAIFSEPPLIGNYFDRPLEILTDGLLKGCFTSEMTSNSMTGRLSAEIKMIKEASTGEIEDVVIIRCIQIGSIRESAFSLGYTEAGTVVGPGTSGGGTFIGVTSGTSGTSGINGTSGTSGFGTDGTSGSSGTSGDGTSGTSGTSGETGTSGTSGNDGTSGTSGTSGNDGTSGTSGTSGISGSVGTSGTSGVNFTGYDYEIHVSQVDGNDTTGNGELLNPVASITKALTLITAQRRIVIVHPGGYTESPTITDTNTTIATTELTGGGTVLYGTLTIGSTGSGSRISGFSMNNLAITGTAQAYVSNCTINNNLTKSSSGYVEIINTEMQCTAGINISGPGLMTINGNKNVGISVSNAGAILIVKDCNSVVTPSASAGTLNLVNCIITALGSNALTVTGASTVLTLANCEIITQEGNSVAPISVAGIFSIFNTVYDKPGSTFTGTSTNSIDYFQYINADKFITQGGTSNQFVKGDGSLDSTGPVSGTSGSAGTSGTSGITGTSGSSGTAGTSGTSGLGTSGTSGTSFASPYSGNLNVTSGQAWVSLDANGNTTSTTAVDWNTGNVQTFTLNSNPTTFTFSNGQAGATYILIVRQSASGSFTVNWPGAVTWSTTPTMTATASRYDIYTFIYDGSKYFGTYVQNYV